MNPLRIAAWAVQLVCDLFAPVEKMHPWPASEQPLIMTGEESGTKWTWPSVQPTSQCIHAFGDDHPCARCGRAGGNVTAEPPAAFEPMPVWFRGGFDDETSAPSGSTSLAGVDPYAEGPTPGATHHPGVGQPTNPKLQKLLRASASQLYGYATHIACPAAVYVNSLAHQLQDAANAMDTSNQ